MQPEDNRSQHYTGLRSIIRYSLKSQCELLGSTQLVFDELEPVINYVIRNKQATQVNSENKDGDV
jgi:hypothetical protein